MRQVLVDPYSICACPISMFCNRHLIGNATGFFWKHANEIYLISNWHVFSGRIPTSGQPINLDGAVPDIIKVTAASTLNINNNFTIKIITHNLDGQPAWLQSKEYGQQADLAAYNVTNLMRENPGSEADINLSEHVPCINEAPQVSNMFSGVGCDVFVLGFPLGLMKTGIFPVWKRASIATEFQYDVNDMPSFLIDTATREGMSGAPVIQRATNGYMTTDGDVAFRGITNQVLGIYSGRYIGELDEAHLGIVWKTNLIEKIILDSFPGDFILF